MRGIFSSRNDGASYGQVSVVLVWLFCLALYGMLMLSGSAFSRDLGGGCKARILSFAYLHDGPVLDRRKVVLSAEYSGCSAGTNVYASIAKQGSGVLSFGHLSAISQEVRKFPTVTYHCLDSDVEFFQVTGIISTGSKVLAKAGPIWVCGR